MPIPTMATMHASKGEHTAAETEGREHGGVHKHSMLALHKSMETEARAENDCGGRGCEDRSNSVDSLVVVSLCGDYMMLTTYRVYKRLENRFYVDRRPVKDEIYVFKRAEIEYIDKDIWIDTMGSTRELQLVKKIVMSIDDMNRLKVIIPDSSQVFVFRGDNKCVRGL